MPKILMIDDDGSLAVVVGDHFKFEGYDLQHIRDGREGLKQAQAHAYDLILLDITLPGFDGYEVLRELRKTNKETPVIITTARDKEEDKIFGFNLGADDYVVKPYSLAELTARTRAHIRRVNLIKGSQVLNLENMPGYEPVSIRVGDSVVYLDKMMARVGEKENPLTPKEIGIIRLLYRNRGKVVPREAMMREIWGNDVYITERVIDTNVVSIRKKVGDHGRKPKYIKTVFGIGYKMVEG